MLSSNEQFLSFKHSHFIFFMVGVLCVLELCQPHSMNFSPESFAVLAFTFSSVF